MEPSTSQFKIHSFETSHINKVIQLFLKNTNRKLSYDKIENAIERYPALIVKDENKIIGFAYTGRFAPDILELYNIFVNPGQRNHSIGSSLLRKLEEKCKEEFNAIILVNSLLYKGKSKEKYATNFYLKNDYTNVAETSSTKVFFKPLL